MVDTRMCGVLLGLILLALLQCRNRSAADYFPMASGYRWSYTLNQDGDPYESQLSVVEASGDRFTLRQSSESSDGWACFPFFLNEDAHIVRTDSGIVCLDGAPWLLLKLPLEIGDAWYDGDDSAFVFDKATVSAPAGDFQDCFRVGYRAFCFGDPGWWVYSYVWYAPNVGIVRVDDEVNDEISELISSNF